MAGYQSANNIPQLPEYQGTVPLDMLGKAGIMHQGEYDRGLAAIQAPADQLSQYPIIKDSDREMINNKMNDLVSKTNAFSGQDLGDSRVLSKIGQAQDSILRNPDLSTIIGANANAIKQLKTIQKAKDEDDGTYNPDNETVFNKQLNNWLTNPNKKQFNATYTPAYDYFKNVQDVVTQVKNDPDVKSGMVINADGSKRVGTQQEIEQITADKLKLALQSSLPSKAIDQMNIEYQAAMINNPNYSLPGTLNELNSHIGSIQSNIQKLQAFLPHAANKDEYNEAEKMLNDNKEDLEDYNYKRDLVAKTGDPSKYHSWDKYLSDKLNDLGNSYKYTKEGKVTYDEKFLEDHKEANREKLARLKASLQHSLMTEPGAVNTTEEGYKGLAVNGESEFKPSDVYAMQNFNGKLHEDGSMDVPLGDKKQVLDVKPLLDAIPGLKVSSQQALGVGKIMTEYSKWLQTPAGNIYTSHPNTNSPYTVGGSTGMGSSGVDNSGVVKTPKSIDQWRASLTSEQIGKTMQETGIDLRDSNAIIAAQALAKNPDVMKQIIATTKVMENNEVRGIVNIMPQPGVNTITMSDGKLYNKMYLQMDEEDAHNAYSNLHDHVNNGIIHKAGINHESDTKDNRSGKQMFQIPIMLQSTRPEGEIMADVINRNPIMKQHAGVYMEHGYNILNLKNYVKQTSEYDMDITKILPTTAKSMAAVQVNSLLQKGHISPVEAQQLLGSNGDGSDGLIGTYTQGLNGNNSSKLTNAAYLKAIITAQSRGDLHEKLKAITKWSAPLNVTTKPTNNASIETEE